MGAPSQRRAVFLDRDDTLLVDEGYMSDPARVTLMRGARDALLRLQGSGFSLVLISNQSGVARGLVTTAQVHAIERRMCALLPEVRFDGFEYCWHHPDEGCGCRKPAPAMILRAAERLGIDTGLSVMVGDKESDVAAGNSAGCWTVRLHPTGSACATAADHQAADLGAAVDWILALGPRRKDRGRG